VLRRARNPLLAFLFPEVSIENSQLYSPSRFRQRKSGKRFSVFDEKEFKHWSLSVTCRKNSCSFARLCLKHKSKKGIVIVMKKLNVPNKLTLLRVLLVPVFMVILITPIFPEPYDPVCLIIAAAIFIVTGVTDFFDGVIARKYHLITNFGKFLDPLADKFMVFGALLSILYRFSDIRPVFIWAAAIVMFRELAVTSVRLIACGHDGIVIAASWLGKIKTFSQIICICTVLLEPVIFKSFPPFGEMRILTYITIGAMCIMTLWSGIDYICKYWSHITPDE